MNRIAMSAAASGLLRALICRAGISRDRILLTEVSSTDWQSLTMVGERHVMELRITGFEADAAARRLCSGLEEAEFDISGQIVADIEAAARSEGSHDGSVTVNIQALTIAD
jgi:hypothetical protein